MDRILRQILVTQLQLPLVECDAIASTQVDEGQVPNLYSPGAASAARGPDGESAVICSLVSTSCVEWVTKSRMTGDCHVRFCEQLRGEIPLG